MLRASRVPHSSSSSRRSEYAPVAGGGVPLDMESAWMAIRTSLTGTYFGIGFASLVAIIGFALGAVAVYRLNHGFTTLSVSNSVLAHIQSEPIPSTHSKQTLANNPAIPPPNATVSLGAVSIGAVTTGSSVAGGTLLFQAVSGTWAVRNLSADQYTSASDTAGTRVLQAGTAETYGGQGDCSGDTSPPGDGKTSTLRIFSSDFKGGLLTIYIRSSTELGFDFVTVRQNANVLYSISGAGPSTTDAYIEQTISINLKGSDTVTVEFVKDVLCWGGYDIVYIYATFASSPNIDTTLPADTSAYVGKDIEICSLDTGAHTVSLLDPLVHFDANGLWQTIQFQANGVDSCCATLSFIAPDRVSITSRDPCTVLCNNASLWHCVDPLRPGETNPFHGNWKAITKTFVDGSYAYVDASKNPMAVSIHKGDVIQPQEATLSYALHPIAPGVFSTTADSNVHNPEVVGHLFTFQPGAQQFIYHVSNDNDAFEAPVSILTLFEKTTVVPPIVPTSSGTLTALEPEDPEALLRNYVRIFLYQAYGSLNGDTKWIGYPAANALLESLISTGTGSITTPIIETRVTQAHNLENITEFRTATYHHAVPPSIVTIAGYTGDCAALNGDHMMAIGATNNIPLPNPLHMDYGTNASSRTVHHKVGVYFDSSAIPVLSGGSQIANCTGSTPTMTVSYGPINSNTNYIRTMGAMNYWFYEAIKVGLHCRLELFFDESTTIARSGAAHAWQEWSDVISALAAGPDMRFFKKRARSRLVGDASSFHVNAGALITSQRYFGTLTVDHRLWQGRTDLTGRFGIRPDMEASVVMFQTDNSARSTHWIDIPIHNYLEQVAYPAWKMVGTTKTHPLNLVAQVSYPGGGGDEFDTVMVPFGTLPPANYSYLLASALPNGGYSYPYEAEFNFINEINQNGVFVGRVKQAYTSGLNIGYIRFVDTSAHDPLYFSIYAQFCPTGLCNSTRVNREALTSIYATYMQYLLVDLNCTHVIIDIRGNLGGSLFTQVTSRDFFGSTAELPIDGTFASRTDAGNGASIDLKTLQYGNNVLTKSLDNYRINPALSESSYPNSVLTNGEVVFLTNTDAGSGGDVFPNYFLGAAFDGQLGNNTQVSMIGSIDGRLTGYFGVYALPTSRDSPRLKDAVGVAQPISVSVDAGTEFRRADGTLLTNSHAGLSIDSANGLTGLAGGNPLPQDWDELVYKDLGYVTNTRTVLPGWTGPQTPSNIVEVNPLSTTSGSSIVTVTTSSPHGYATGDDVALGSTAIPVADVNGVSGRALTGGHIITVTGANTFTFDAQDIAMYPGFNQTNATSTGSGVGGTIRITNRSQWRDHWLEASVSTIVAQAKKKKRFTTTRSSRRGDKQEIERRRKQTTTSSSMIDRAQTNAFYKRDTSCPSGVELTPVATAAPTRTVRVERNYDSEVQRTKAITSTIQEISDTIREELASGGMCLTDSGVLMATPSLKNNVKIAVSTVSTLGRV